MSDKTKIQVGVRNALLVIFGVLLIDQWSKIYVKLNFTMDEEVSVFGDWFILHFTENPGMAFGMEFGGEYGKLALTLFRILAVSGLGYYLFSQIKSGATMGYILCLALITAGASGNIIDSIFYGMYFSESTHYELATAFPETGYAAIFHGRVVDMLYLPIFKGFLPEWLGGDYFIFFRPIFNIADASISIGVFLIMIFQKRFFSEKPKVEMESAGEEIEAFDSDLNTEQLTDDKKKN